MDQAQAPILMDTLPPHMPISTFSKLLIRYEKKMLFGNLPGDKEPASPLERN